MGLYRPIKGELPYLWLETNYLKVHDGGRCGDNCRTTLATWLLTELMLTKIRCVMVVSVHATSPTCYRGDTGSPE